MENMLLSLNSIVIYSLIIYYVSFSTHTYIQMALFVQHKFFLFMYVSFQKHNALFVLLIGEWLMVKS